MKNLLCLITLATLPMANIAFAQDVGKLVEAVDKDKAADSVDMDKVKDAMTTKE